MPGEDDSVILLDWHRPLWSSRFRSRAVPASMLLAGSRGSGVREFGLALARALVCARDTTDGTPCGTCDDCRWSGAGRHPDLLLLGDFAVPEAQPGEPGEDPSGEADDPPDKSSAKDRHLIPIPAIRRLIAFLQVSPNRDRARVAVLSPAEWMNAAAANGLLKMLEEPPGQAHLILVSHAPARLPATIRSRCIRLRVPDPTHDEARAWLDAQGVPNPDLVLAQTGGSPLAAAELPEPYWEARARLLPGLAEQNAPRRQSMVLRQAEGLELRVCHRLLHTWCLDLATLRAGGTARYHPDYERPLSGLASALSLAPLLAFESRLQASRRWLDHPLNPKLAVEDLLLGYLAIFERH